MNPEIKARNIKRLKRNIEELRRKLEDIENAYPYANAPKFVTIEYWDLQAIHDENLKELEALQ